MAYPRTNKIYLERSEKIVSIYETGKTVQETAMILGITKDAVKYCLEKKGIKTRESRHDRKYKVNDNIFKTPSEERNYWIGFLMADGSVVKSEKHKSTTVQLQIAARDLAHVEKFRDFLEAENPVKVYTTKAGRYLAGSDKPTGETSTANLGIKSLIMGDDLATFGVTPRKTGKEKLLDESLLHCRHFWRGMIDGDGSLHTNKDNVPHLSLVGSQEIIQQFIDFAKIHCPDTKTTPKHDKNGLYVVGFSFKQADTLIKVLYNDAPIALDRKAEKAKEAIKAWEIRELGVEQECPQCNKMFIRERDRPRARFCSPACVTDDKKRRVISYRIEKDCIICGGKYIDSRHKSLAKKTCSHKCGAKLRLQGKPPINA